MNKQAMIWHEAIRVQNAYSPDRFAHLLLPAEVNCPAVLRQQDFDHLYPDGAYIWAARLLLVTDWTYFAVPVGVDPCDWGIAPAQLPDDLRAELEAQS